MSQQATTDLLPVEASVLEMLKRLSKCKGTPFSPIFFQVWDLTLTILGLGPLASFPSTGTGSCRRWAVFESSAGCSSLLTGTAAFSTSLRGHLVSQKLWGVPGRNLEFTPDLANDSPFCQAACSSLTVLSAATEGFSFKLCSEGRDQPHLKHTCVAQQMTAATITWPSRPRTSFNHGAGVGSVLTGVGSVLTSSWGPMSYSHLVVFPPFRRQWLCATSEPLPPFSLNGLQLPPVCMSIHSYFFNLIS